MTRLLVINPNTSSATTAMMVAIAQTEAGAGADIIGATARRGPSMILDPAALAASAAEVVEIGVRHAPEVDGIVVSAFGDPGLDALRHAVAIPVIGIAEAGMIAAAAGGRRFGVATTTPALVGAIDAKAAALGLAHLYTGTRLAAGDATSLVADPAALVAALAEAVRRCLETDQAEAVVIGGGPLGDAATALTLRFAAPVMAPIPAAVRRLLAILTA